MDHDAGNAAARQRLRALVARITDDDLRRVVGQGWTVAATLAHMAFWDRVKHASWRAILAGGPFEDASATSGRVDWTNEAALPQWTALPPRAAAEDAVRAAEDLDALIAGLPAWASGQAAAHGRPGMLDRARHRGEHLDQIDVVLMATPQARQT